MRKSKKEAELRSAKRTTQPSQSQVPQKGASEATDMAEGFGQAPAKEARTGAEL